MATLLAIHFGQPRDLGSRDATNPLDKPWRSAIFKTLVAGPIWLGTTNLAGDGQADARHHGGPHQAVLGYSAEHYPAWNRDLAPLTLPFGAFAENFTIGGHDDASVCIGDTYAIGSAAVQVSQPRQPCVNLARRWHLPDLPARVLKAARGGWYLRVLTEGMVEAGMDVQLLERPFPDFTIQRVLWLRRDGADATTARKLATCSALSPGWQQIFAKMADVAR